MGKYLTASLQLIRNTPWFIIESKKFLIDGKRTSWFHFIFFFPTAYFKFGKHVFQYEIYKAILNEQSKL